MKPGDRKTPARMKIAAQAVIAANKLERLPGLRENIQSAKEEVKNSEIVIQQANNDLREAKENQTPIEAYFTGISNDLKTINEKNLIKNEIKTIITNYKKADTGQTESQTREKDYKGVER